MEMNKKISIDRDEILWTMTNRLENEQESCFLLHHQFACCKLMMDYIDQTDINDLQVQFLYPQLIGFFAEAD